MCYQLQQATTTHTHWNQTTKLYTGASSLHSVPYEPVNPPASAARVVLLTQQQGTNNCATAIVVSKNACNHCQPTHCPARKHTMLPAQDSRLPRLAAGAAWRQSRCTTPDHDILAPQAAQHSRTNRAPAAEKHMLRTLHSVTPQRDDSDTLFQVNTAAAWCDCSTSCVTHTAYPNSSKAPGPSRHRVTSAVRPREVKSDRPASGWHNMRCSKAAAAQALTQRTQ